MDEVHSVLLSEVDVDAPVAVHPAIFDGQPHPVQQKAVEDLWVVHHVGGGGGHISGGSIGWGGNPWSVDGDNMIAAYTRYPD